MDPYQNSPQLNVHGRAAGVEGPTSVQMAPAGKTRQCPFCCEVISRDARKCWRCLEYFSQPAEELDERTYQFARREVLQDCVADIKKWITRIGVGSAVGIALVGLLSVLRLQDVLEQMVVDRVEVATQPVLVAAEEKLDASETVLDDMQDNIRVAQHRISQFDWLDDKLSETETAVLKIEGARQGLEKRAEGLTDQFGQLEHRLTNAKRELRDDRDRRLEEMLGNFTNQVVTFEKLRDVLTQTQTPASRELLTALSPLEHRKIGLISPYTMSREHHAVVFSSSVRLQWQYGGQDLGEVTYRVRFDTQKDFNSGQARQETTRLTNHSLPVDFPHGPVFWQVEAVGRDGQVQATSDVGMFEFYADSIDRIRHTGVIRVGVAVSSQGEFAYFDELQGMLTGFDIELTRWLAARLLPDMPQVRPVFVGYNWNRLLDSVSRNEVDFIISTITITPEREEEFGLKFSHPYYRTKQACVVLKESGIRSVAQLQGRRLAVQSGTTSEPVGEAFTEPTNLVRAASSEVAYDALLKGQVEAVITDYDFAQGEVRNLGRAAAVIALQESDFPENYSGIRAEKYGIAVAKPETNLLTRINNAIDLATSANVLETLKLRFVMGEQEPGILKPLPNPEIAMPMIQNWSANGTLRR